MKTLLAAVVALCLAIGSTAATAYPAPKKSGAGQKATKSDKSDGGLLPGGFVKGVPSQVCGAASLSEARQKIFAELDDVTPSVQGMSKSSGHNFFDGAAGLMTKAQYDALPKNAQGMPVKPITTTCGMLPGAMLKRLGFKGPLAGSATEGMRICGQGLGKGVWHENDGKALPKPGDLYWLRYAASPGLDSVSHVGIICSTEGDTWKTVDAGQGGPYTQMVQIVARKTKRGGKSATAAGDFVYIAGAGSGLGDPAGVKRLGGWIDLDALMENKAKADKLKLTVKGYSATCK
jgi:hypothetical protein